MEIISLKLNKKMLENIDKILDNHNYSTRTEFIREALREKIEEYNRDDLLKELLSLNKNEDINPRTKNWKKVKVSYFGKNTYIII